MAGPDAEKSRLIFSAAAALSAAEGVEWLLVVDHRYRQGLFPSLPGRTMVRRALPGRVGQRHWYDRQLPRLAKRQRVDRVWLTGGIAGPAGGLEVPVCLWMPERANPDEWIGPRNGNMVYRSRLKASLALAGEVICYSERDRIWLEGIGAGGKEKIRVCTVAAGESAGVMPDAAREKVKAEHTQGKEYFLADLSGCGEEDAMNLLKAFSLFKRRQQSGMRLVLAGRMKATGEIAERLKTYKYRQDVDWAADAGNTERLGLAGAAYAVILPVEGNSLGTTLLDRWKTGVPVIAVNGGIFEDMAQGAVLAVAPGDPTSLAGQLMRIYKEEDLRRELIGKGFERLRNYSGRD